MDRVSVVFVRFGLPAMENDTLATLIAHTCAREWSLRVSDNWGNPETLTGLWDRVWREEADAGARVICFLNSDCWVGPSWDQPILACMQNKDVAVVGPYANHGPQTTPPEILVPRIRPTGWPDLSDIKVAAGQCAKHYRGYMFEHEVFGFCFCVSVHALEAADGFRPEIKAGYTLYGSEQAFSRRIRALGMKVVIAADSYAYHLGQASGKRGQEAGIVDPVMEQAKGRALFFGKQESE